MSRFSEVNFVRQQGFRNIGAESCGYRYPALMFQPKVIAFLVLIGIVMQSAPLFICLSAILVWSALLPALNPFDALYNSLIAAPKQLSTLTPAPAPRRFAQGMAATFMLAIAIFLYAGWEVAAWIIEGVLAMALAALVFGRFCLGSYLYHLLRKETGFANRTLPWKRESRAAIRRMASCWQNRGPGRKNPRPTTLRLNSCRQVRDVRRHRAPGPTIYKAATREGLRLFLQRQVLP